MIPEDLLNPEKMAQLDERFPTPDRAKEQEFEARKRFESEIRHIKTRDALYAEQTDIYRQMQGISPNTETYQKLDRRHKEITQLLGGLNERSETVRSNHKKS